VQRSQPRSATGALAAAAAATVASTLGRVPALRDEEPPPAYTAVPLDGNEQRPPADPPPAYTRVPAGSWDPKDLTDFQLDELAHRIIGRVTRMLRTELRMDRERIGRLRDDRR
jgi:hypothetical protein